MFSKIFSILITAGFAFILVVMISSQNSRTADYQSVSALTLNPTITPMPSPSPTIPPIPKVTSLPLDVTAHSYSISI